MPPAMRVRTSSGALSIATAKDACRIALQGQSLEVGRCCLLPPSARSSFSRLVVIAGFGCHQAAGAPQDVGAGQGVVAQKAGRLRVGNAQALQQRVGRVRVACCIRCGRVKKRVSWSAGPACCPAAREATGVITVWMGRFSVSGSSEATAKAPPPAVSNRLAIAATMRLGWCLADCARRASKEWLAEIKRVFKTASSRRGSTEKPKRSKVIRLKHCADWENLQFALRQKNG